MLRYTYVGITDHWDSIDRWIAYLQESCIHVRQVALLLKQQSIITAFHCHLCAVHATLHKMFGLSLCSLCHKWWFPVISLPSSKIQCCSGSKHPPIISHLPVPQCGPGIGLHFYISIFSSSVVPINPLNAVCLTGISYQIVQSHHSSLVFVTSLRSILEDWKTSEKVHCCLLPDL